MKKIGFFGAGNMAEAIARSLHGLMEIRAYDISEKRLNLFADFGVTISQTVEELVAESNIILLAVKPQGMTKALEDLAPYVTKNILVVSIAAGVTVARISSVLGSEVPIVRVMPNTPVIQNRGMVGIYGGPSVTADHIKSVIEIFSSSSQMVVVDDEDLMDGVTAVSGSGPAYFFYMVEAMIAAGVAEGLSEEESKLLAAATCMGAGAMLLNSPDSPAQLRATVTSPNGTTQAAIESMEASGVKESIFKAVRAAADRSRELRSS